MAETPQVHGKTGQSAAIASIASHTCAVCLGAMDVEWSILSIA
jgi:hypothetical protein